MTFDPKEALALVSRAKGRITPCNATTADIVSLCTSLTAALDENERLRVAVEEIAAPPAVAMDSADRVEALRDIARAVLKGAL